jgi:hypothetical protein
MNLKRKIMKKIVLSAFIAATLLSGCSTAYQIGQTPDDVYFSPGQEVESSASNNNNDERYQEFVSTMDDRYLRMRVANRNRWSTIDNFSYWNDMRHDFAPYSFNHFNSFNPWIQDPFRFNLNPWSIGFGFRPGINAWNNFYGGGWNGGIFGNRMGWGNPMFSVLNYANPKFITPSFNAGSNLNALRNRNYNNSNNVKGGNWYAPGGTNSSNNFGNLVKRVFANPNTSGGSATTFDRSVRTFGNSSNGTPATSSNAGGASGGFKSTGSSASTGRGGRN